MSSEEAANIRDSIRHLAEVVETRLDGQGDRLKDIERRIYGPSDEPEKGMTVKLDRVTQAQGRQSKLMWMVIAALVAEAAHMLFTAM